MKMKFTGSSYAGELEWKQKIATKYSRDKLSLSNDSLHIFSDCQSAIVGIMS